MGVSHTGRRKSLPGAAAALLRALGAAAAVTSDSVRMGPAGERKRAMGEEAGTATDQDEEEHEDCHHEARREGVDTRMLVDLFGWFSGFATSIQRGE